MVGLTLPLGCNFTEIGPEVQAAHSGDVAVAIFALSHPSKREGLAWNRHSNIDPNHSSFGFTNEAVSKRTALGEDAGGVSVLVRIFDGDGFAEIFCVDNCQNWSENFLTGSLRMARGMVDDSRS